MTGKRFVADYVIAGAGASGLGFADVIISESDRTVVVVDKQARPGGHWNHAYPFLRLHGPSANYGVNSRKLGRDTIDESGTNAGFYELATATEVLAHFEGLVFEQFLQSGRVTYLPMYEMGENGKATSLLSGETVDIVPTRKFVDAAYLGAVVPSMREHRPSFVYSDDVQLVTPAGLAEIATAHRGYVVIGAGKTSADVCLWLIERGVDASNITWVRPRDAWFQNRVHVQPGIEFAHQTLGGYESRLEAAKEADSFNDLARRYEEAEAFLRIDKEHWPTVFRGATMAQAEIETLRAIEHVVRLGYVRRIEERMMILTEGRVEIPLGSLFVDCSAEGLRRRPPVPFFSDGRITLQYALNGGQPAYSAAIAGFVELALDSDQEKNLHLKPTVITGALDDLASNFLVELNNQMAWSKNSKLRGWLDSSRLNPAKEVLESLHSKDNVLMDIMARIIDNRLPARENLSRLTALM